LKRFATAGYINLRRVADVDERIRRLVRRLKLPARDSELWLGMLRQILWKMKSGERSPNNAAKQQDNDA